MADITLTIDDLMIERLQSLADKKDMPLEDATIFVLERTLFGVDKRIPASVTEYKPQHIPIMIDETADDVKKALRCNTCGNIVFYYYGSIKLITNGIYDSKSMMIEGEERVWDTDNPAPIEVMCQGRVLPEGYSGKVRCGNVYYKIGL